MMWSSITKRLGHTNISGTNKTNFCRGVVGDLTSDQEYPGPFPPQGGPPAGKYSAKEDWDGHVDLSATGHDNERSGYGGVGGVFTPPPEFLCQLYFQSDDTGAMSGGGATSKGTGVYDMEGAGRNQPGAKKYGDVDGDGGGGGRGGQRCVGGGRRGVGG